MDGLPFFLKGKVMENESKELRLVKEWLQKQIEDTQIKIHQLTGSLMGFKMALDRTNASITALSRPIEDLPKVEVATKSERRPKNASD